MTMNAAPLDYFLPYQVRWINEVSPVSIGEKSRRIGWTYASSYRAVDRRVRLGTNLYFSSADLSTAREFVDYCRRWAELMNFTARQSTEENLIDDERITSFVLTFTNGLKAYLSGDTAVMGDMKTIINGFYRVNLAVVNMGPLRCSRRRPPLPSTSSSSRPQ